MLGSTIFDLADDMQQITKGRDPYAEIQRLAIQRLAEEVAAVLPAALLLSPLLTAPSG